MSTTTKTTKKTAVKKTVSRAKTTLVMNRDKKAKPVTTAKKNALTARSPFAPKVSKPRVFVPVNQLGVVDQITNAFARHNMFATVLGVLIGSFVPVAVCRRIMVFRFIRLYGFWCWAVWSTQR